MSAALEAAAVSVRLRRLWLEVIAPSPVFADSDLAGVSDAVRLRRVGNALVLGTPVDFGEGNPFAGDLGAFARDRVSRATAGVVDSVTWEFEPDPQPVRRARSSDLDVFAPGDPSLDQLPRTLEKLRRAMPDSMGPAAREAVGELRLVAQSRHHLWFAAATQVARDDLGRVPGARAALVQAVGAFQRHAVALHRVVVDPSFTDEEMRL